MVGFNMNMISLESGSKEPKYVQIKNGIIDSIRSGKLKKGDELPSLKGFSSELNVGLNTVIKAYDALKKQGVIESSFGKAFYIATERVTETINTFVLFDELSPFKAELFNSIEETVGEGATLDIYFHHQNFELFQSLIKDNKSSFQRFVIIPQASERSMEILKELPSEKLLVLDQLHFSGDGFNYLVQDYVNDTYQALVSGKDLLAKYKQINFVQPDSHVQQKLSAFVNPIIEGCQKFCQEVNMKFEVIEGLTADDLRTDEVYIDISMEDLVNLVKAAKSKEYTLGQDIGVISFNDSMIKEVVAEGITCISTDFLKMGQSAAQFILEGEKIQQVNPSSLIIRKSL